MQDFVHRLYRIADTRAQTRREDYCSLWLAHLLHDDDEFKRAFTRRLAEEAQHPMRRFLKGWLDAQNSRLEVDTQQWLWAPGGKRLGRSDVFLTFDDGEGHIEHLVIEAKVDDEFKGGQVATYAQDRRRPLVVLLARNRVPTFRGLQMTWAEVLAIAEEADRSGLARSFAAFLGRIDVPRAARTPSPGALSAHLALRPLYSWCSWVLDALVPLSARTKIEERRSLDGVDSDLGWGCGFESSVQGVPVNGIVVGVHLAREREIGWHVEVCASKKKVARENLRMFSPVRGFERESKPWYSVDLGVCGRSTDALSVHAAEARTRARSMMRAFYQNAGLRMPLASKRENPEVDLDVARLVEGIRSQTDVERLFGEAAMTTVMSATKGLLQSDPDVRKGPNQYREQVSRKPWVRVGARWILTLDDLARPLHSDGPAVPSLCVWIWTHSGGRGGTRRAGVVRRMNGMKGAGEYVREQYGSELWDYGNAFYIPLNTDAEDPLGVASARGTRVLRAVLGSALGARVG